ncbi:hypothetical protein BDZ94DRAFT_503442 [Collybia nuda]|uniref:Uncharacterized protein n=1 Tax=Collybia nuda TaxID=64659 RepID=A0A9P5Y8Q8_9AGAR|nr:hypothetical protein BDZ94DRAFT_503442 [Collybia nuda]
MKLYDEHVTCWPRPSPAKLFLLCWRGATPPGTVLGVIKATGSRPSTHRTFSTPSMLIPSDRGPAAPTPYMIHIKVRTKNIAALTFSYHIICSPGTGGFSCASMVFLISALVLRGHFEGC